MNRRMSIPVKVIPPADSQAGSASTASYAPPPQREVRESEAQAVTEPGERMPSPDRVLREEARPQTDTADEAERWRDRALRLQAEMDNYRKRQQRLADERIRVEHERVLEAFLGVVDDLERALKAPIEDGASLRHGVAMTHRTAMQWLKREGVDQIEAENQAFDPAWHEAVATTQSSGAGAVPGTVVKVLEAGYRMGDRLLRPAKVVVAV